MTKRVAQKPTVIFTYNYVKNYWRWLLLLSWTTMVAR